MAVILLQETTLSVPASCSSPSLKSSASSHAAPNAVRAFCICSSNACPRSYAPPLAWELVGSLQAFLEGSLDCTLLEGSLDCTLHGSLDCTLHGPANCRLCIAVRTALA